MKSQQLHKVINYYRIEHNFHSPYHLLIDGNFIKWIVEKQFNLEEKMKKILIGKIRIYCTSCIIKELQMLGKEFIFILKQAKQMKEIKCKHKMQHTVDKCILQQIGSVNQNQYMVCTQDITLRQQLRQISNVPLLYFGPDQRLTIEQVNRKILKNQQQLNFKKYIPQQIQQQEIQKYKDEKKIIQLQQKKKQMIKTASVKGIKIKTKIIKGPNPLSVKKKKKKNKIIINQEESQKFIKSNKKNKIKKTNK